MLCALAVPGLAKEKPPAHPINLNTATAAELQQVPGIGPSTAVKILQMRKSYGAFKTVDDLRAVRGIGEKRLAKMRKPARQTTACGKIPAIPVGMAVELDLRFVWRWFCQFVPVGGAFCGSSLRRRPVRDGSYSV
jgi:competence ComEA-like helix-hairpin-helix protein